MNDAKGNGAPKNPFLQGIAQKAATAAAVNKLRDKAQDEFWIASMELRTLEGQQATFPQTESGLAAPPGYQRRLARARERVHQAEHEFRQAADRARAVNAELQLAQANAREWERRETYWANQREQEAALSPREKAIREARKLLDEAGR